MVVAGLQHWFRARGRFDLAASVADGAQLIDALASVECDLIVLSGGIENIEDIEGQGDDAFALLRAVRALRPDTPVVIFTDERDPAALVAMQRAGATGIASVLDDARAFERVCDRVLSGAKHVVSTRIAACSQPVAEAPIVIAAPAEPADASPDYGNMRLNIRQVVGRT
ncbi:Two component transcriptional regulator LuxR family (plasmid) [Caballeronia insecticola]|uniref:Two component transcriptional regulator LuxR family n=1 Tax=Caballeronia insecticola TaxID=758793 RepID=R4X491_9BURK|nr:Two component transcriptional regulator LuxR family [Caballeronia insecticola]